MNNYLNLKITKEIGYIPTDEEISSAEKEMDIKFSDSYVKFIKNYGAGLLSDTFRIYMPGRAKEEYDILVRSREDKSLIIENIDMDVWEYQGVEPTDKWLGGLFPFGSSKMGDLLCWDTHSDMTDGEYTIFLLDDEQAYAPRVGETFDEFVNKFCLGGDIDKLFPIGKGEKWNLGNTFEPE